MTLIWPPTARALCHCRPVLQQTPSLCRWQEDPNSAISLVLQISTEQSPGFDSFARPSFCWAKNPSNSLAQNCNLYGFPVCIWVTFCTSFVEKSPTNFNTYLFLVTLMNFWETGFLSPVLISLRAGVKTAFLSYDIQALNPSFTITVKRHWLTLLGTNVQTLQFRLVLFVFHHLKSQSLGR